MDLTNLMNNASVFLGRQKRISGEVTDVIESMINGERYFLYKIKKHDGEQVFVHSREEFEKLVKGKRVRAYVNDSEKLNFEIGWQKIESRRLKRYKAKAH